MRMCTFIYSLKQAKCKLIFSKFCCCCFSRIAFCRKHYISVHHIASHLVSTFVCFAIAKHERNVIGCWTLSRNERNHKKNQCALCICARKENLWTDRENLMPVFPRGFWISLHCVRVCVVLVLFYSTKLFLCNFSHRANDVSLSCFSTQNSQFIGNANKKL